MSAPLPKGADEKRLSKCYFVENQAGESKKEYNNSDPIEISPRCDKARVLTSDGNFLPCDWIRNPLTYYKSDLYKEPHWLERLDIRKCNLDEALEVIEEWKAQVKEKGLLGTCSTLCKMKCRSSYANPT